MYDTRISTTGRADTTIEVVEDHTENTRVVLPVESTLRVTTKDACVGDTTETGREGSTDGLSGAVNTKSTDTVGVQNMWTEKEVGAGSETCVTESVEGVVQTVRDVTIGWT